MTDTFKMADKLVQHENHIDKLENALFESLKLQSYYADLLNMYDNGKRLQFKTIGDWLKRLDNLNNTLDELGRK